MRTGKSEKLKSGGTRVHVICLVFAPGQGHLINGQILNHKDNHDIKHSKCIDECNTAQVNELVSSSIYCLDMDYFIMLKSCCAYTTAGSLPTVYIWYWFWPHSGWFMPSIHC